MIPVYSRKFIFRWGLFLAVFLLLSSKPSPLPSVPAEPTAGNAGFLSTGFQNPAPTSVPVIPQVSLWATEQLPSTPGVQDIASALDAQGKIHLIWTAFDSDGTSYNLHLFYSARSPETGWVEPVEIYKESSPETFPFIDNLDIAIDGNGNPFTIYFENPTIFFAEASSSGAWTAPAPLPPTLCTDCYVSSPDLAVDTAGQLHLVWMKDGSVLYTTRPAGGEWSQVQQISAPDTHNQKPSLLVEPWGRVHAFWIEDKDVDHTLTTTVFNGPAWSQPTSLGLPAHSVYTYATAQDSKGGLYLVFKDSSRSNIKSSLFYLDCTPGGAWSALKEVPGVFNLGTDIFLAATGEGDLILVWGEQQVVYSTRPRGGSWSTPINIPESAFFGNTLLVSSQKQVILTWWADGLWAASADFSRVAQAVSAFQPVTPSGLPDFIVRSGASQVASPAVDGNIVVWQEMGATTRDLYASNVKTTHVFPVSTASGDQLLPAIDNELVVWEDHRDTTPRIYGRFLEQGDEFAVTADSSPQWQPDVSGKIVVFRDWRKTGTCGWGGSLFGTNLSCDWDIWSANLGNHEELLVDIARDTSASSPKISGNRIIWLSNDGKTVSIMGGLVTSKNLPQKLTPISSYSPLSLDGDILVFVDSRDSLNGVFAYNLRTGSVTPVALGTREEDPVISGTWVAWTDTRNGDKDIYAYNLATGQELPVCTAPGDQISPAISGDLLVWVDQRHFTTEIYGARLPSDGGAQTSQVVPAATPTAIPMPTDTPGPTPSPTFPAVLPAPVLLAPTDGALVTDLAPRLEFDFGDLLPEDWHYRVDFESDPTFPLTGCEEDALHYTCYASENLKPGVSYRWQVKWQDFNYRTSEAGSWVASPIWSFTISPSPAVAPPAPEILFPKDGSEVDLTEATALQWKPVEGAILYDLWVFWGLPDYPGANWANYLLREPTFNLLTFSNDIQSDCRWAVRAFNGSAWSAWSEVAKVWFKIK
jgi:TolB protein